MVVVIHHSRGRDPTTTPFEQTYCQAVARMLKGQGYPEPYAELYNACLRGARS